MDAIAMIMEEEIAKEELEKLLGNNPYEVKGVTIKPLSYSWGPKCLVYKDNVSVYCKFSGPLASSEDSLFFRGAIIYSVSLTSAVVKYISTRIRETYGKKEIDEFKIFLLRGLLGAIFSKEYNSREALEELRREVLFNTKELEEFCKEEQPLSWGVNLYYEDLFSLGERLLEEEFKTTILIR